MVDFDPRYTEIVFFDTESYVPPDQRVSKGSMIYNPAKIDHFFLGGVFCRQFPLQGKTEEPQHIWSWEKEGEKETLRKIYEYFTQSWKMLEGKTDENPDLILCGIGISRHDVPALYVRSVLRHIAKEEELYETYFKTKMVDLSNVGIALFKNNQALYPKTANALIARLRISSQKASGKTVWDLYDAGEYDAIKSRTAAEVADLMEMASRIVAGRF